MNTRLSLPVEGPFSLAAAAAFGFGPNAGAPRADANLMRLAFVTDDLRHQAGAVLMQQTDGIVTADITGDAPAADLEKQLRRVLSIDTDVAGWLAAGSADPVLGSVQARFPGLRPVLFHSPYEAAAWSVLSQRRHRAQATALRCRLSESAGVSFDLAGQREHAFPLPERLLAVSEFPGIEAGRMARLHGVAQAALDGRLDVTVLQTAPAAAAMAALQQINGLGPVYAMLVYLRSTGVKDGLAVGEPRLAACLRHYYGLSATPDPAAIERIAEPWRPFRTWAGVLFRAAGERDELPFEMNSSRAVRTRGGGRQSRLAV